MIATAVLQSVEELVTMVHLQNRPTTVRRIYAFIVKEVEELLPPTVFFALGFCLIEFTTQLVLNEYSVRFANFMLAIVGALVVGKAVLVANLLPFLRRFDGAPLIRPIVFKTVVFSIAVLLVRVLEVLAEYLISGGRLAGMTTYIASRFSWDRIAANQLWIFVLFLIYTSVSELNRRLGDGELARMLFTQRPLVKRPATPI